MTVATADIFILTVIFKTILKYNPRMLHSVLFPLCISKMTFYCHICLIMNHIILFNRKQRGGITGIKEEKQ